VTTAFQCLIVILFGLVFASCSGGSKSAAAGEDSGEPATPVEVARAERKTIHKIISAEAILYPIRQANIVPKISAPVQRFLAQRGDHVHEGQLLAVLEGKDLTAAAEESKKLYEQAQAAYQSTTAATMPDDLIKAQTDVASARSALDAARRVYESRQTLLQQGALAQKMVEDAKVALVQAQSQYETAQQHLNSLQTVGRAEQVKAAQAQRDAAKAHYESLAAQASYAEIRSPINGIVSDRPVNIGEMASSSSALFSILDISRVTARANVPVREAAAIHVGSPVTISAPGAQTKGNVTVVSPAVDPNTTTIQVWVEAANPREELKPGVPVQILIQAGEIPNATVVPVAALLSSDEGGEKVMVAGSDGLAHEHKVETGVREGDDVQIASGLNPGDSVITVGGLGLDDKAKIEVGKPDGKEEDDKKEAGKPNADKGGEK
jgi:HlyD family secretion protein